MPDDELRREIERLRDWRHNQVVPELSSLRGRLHVAEGRLDRVEPQVERLAHADEIADAVKRVVWKAALALGAFIVGTATVAGVIAAFVMH